jgi:prepilin-type N-terminal cleavage/methylation domain-containing protein
MSVHLARRRGFSLIELLVVIAILGVLIGLTLGAVQKARAAAGRVQCANNIHQLLLAAYLADDAYGYVPGNPFADNNVVGTTFYHLLPFMEGTALYENHAYSAMIPTFRCPGDPSSPSGANGPGNYATNDLLFNTHAGSTRVSFSTSMPGGASNTILFAEKYAACSNWASVADGAPLNCFKPAYTAVTTGGPPYPFQVSPAPKDCNCAVPQTSHGNVIQVGMGDGSVRGVHANISNAIWYSANDPSDGRGLDN